MEPLQELIRLDNKDVEKENIMADKTVAEEVLVRPVPNDDDIIDLNERLSTMPKAFQSPSDNRNCYEKDRFELENNLIKFVCEDDSLELVSLFKSLHRTKASETTDTNETPKYEDHGDVFGYVLPCRLLHLACKLDSIASASAILEGETGFAVSVNALDEYGKAALHHAADSHALRCMDLLLRKQARTDLKSKDGQIPLEIALLCKRMQVHWSSSTSIAELLRLIGQKDITAVRVLAESTKDVPQIAYKYAMDGCIVAFAMLLLVSGDSIIAAFVQNHEDTCIQTTIFENVVKKAISLRQTEARGNNDNDSEKGSTEVTTSGNIEQRKVLLSEIELLLRFKAGVRKPREIRKLNSAPASACCFLIRASQAGDEAVTKLLLNGNFDPNETDGDGNTPLHWCLRTTSSTQDTRLVWLLLRHGASVTVRNRLGLTPVHMAAGHGHIQGLQILLFRDPESVDIAAETKETPLFYAVKNNHVECARLLLRYGANRQALNLRKQRPFDVAESQDMREMLSQLNFPSGKLKELTNPIPAISDITLPENQNCFDNYAKFQCMKDENTNQIQDRDQCEESAASASSKMSVHTKTEICRYYELPGGCVRGDKCFYAHGEGELRRVKMISADTKHGISQASFRSVKRIPEDLQRKVFVGGLSPSVESDDLRDFFESKFGPVLDAIVIGSQAGEHIQSRGFGFVTFKYEESVESAVQAHYVTIFGKKVEIKGAVPKSMLTTLEMMKGTIHESASSSKQESVQEDINEAHRSRKQIVTVWDKVLAVQQENPEMQIPSLPCNLHMTPESNTSSMSTSNPPWVERFKQWLPEFLGEVSKRLKEGEWYPLSSLKGDFRATCSMELDHASLGYFKLSDFMRSMPGLCRMKIVPVGRGPATHMVLLESLPKHPSVSSALPHQQAIGSSNPTCRLSSFVDKGRTYAAAAGQGPPISSHKPINAAYSVNPDPTKALTRSDFYEKFQFDFTKASSKAIKSANPLSYHHPTGKFPITTEEDVHYLTNLLSVFNVNPDGNMGANPNPNISVNSSFHINQATISAPEEMEATGTQEQKLPPGYCANDPLHNYVSPTSAPVSHIQPSTPIQAAPLQSQGSSTFLNFLQGDGSSFFTPWSQRGTPPYSRESQLWKPIPDSQLWEKSPQSVLSPYNSQDSLFQVSATVDSPLESLGSSQSELPNCVLCRERKAVWVAVPCAHRALCTLCRNSLKTYQMTMACFVCHQPVDKLIALH